MFKRKVEKSCFFSEGAFCSGSAACVSREEGPVGSAQLGAQCCSQLLSWGREGWVYPLTWKALSQSYEESFGQAEREDERCGSLEQRHICLSNASAAVCGLVQQVKSAALSANSSVCWLQLMWDKVHSANVEVMGEGKSDYLKGGEACFWVTLVSLGHCLGRDQSAAFSCVLVQKARCCSWLSMSPLLRTRFQLSWADARALMAEGWSSPLPDLPLSSHVLLHKLCWCQQHLPEPSAREVIHWVWMKCGGVSGMCSLTLSPLPLDLLLGIISPGSVAPTRQSQLNGWREARVPFELITSYAISVFSPVPLLLLLSGVEARERRGGEELRFF